MMFDVWANSRNPWGYMDIDVTTVINNEQCLGMLYIDSHCLNGKWIDKLMSDVDCWMLSNSWHYNSRKCRLLSLETDDWTIDRPVSALKKILISPGEHLKKTFSCADNSKAVITHVSCTNAGAQNNNDMTLYYLAVQYFNMKTYIFMFHLIWFFFLV